MIKRISAFLMCICLAMAFSLSAFASEPEYAESDRLFYVYYTEIDGEFNVFLVFHAGGQNVKHNVMDLVRDWSSITFFDDGRPFWEQSGRRRFLPQANAMLITTVDGIEYRFDMETGEILSSRNINPIGGFIPQPNFTVGQNIVIGATLTIACILVVVFLYFLESW